MLTDVLKYARIRRVVRAIQDERVLDPKLSFLSRTPQVNASDGELMARFTGRVKIADLVADDSPANVYRSGVLQWEGTLSPNIKHGVSFGQAQINQLMSLNEEAFMDKDGDFRQWMRSTVKGLLRGIDQRKESIIIAGMLDDFDYNRFGIIIDDGRFGMPTDLKVVADPAWSNAASPTVTTIWRIKRIGTERYGVDLRRMTLGSQAFQYLIESTEFQTHVKQLGLISIAMPTGSQLLNTENVDMFKNIASQILGVTIEIYTGRAWNQDEHGIWRSEPLLPLNKVIFTDPADDNMEESYDFSRGIVTESVVNGILRANGMNTGIIGGIPEPVRGPINYVTAANHDLNSPGLVFWGVDRGWFRRHRQQCSASLDIGEVTEDFEVGEIEFD